MSICTNPCGCNSHHLSGFDNAGVANVRCFGAIGDGVADDTAKIQSAINSSPGKGIVFFPAGTYKISSTLVVNRNLALCGAGLGITLLRLSDSAIAELFVHSPSATNGETNVTINNLEAVVDVTDLLSSVLSSSTIRVASAG
jgi:hypothetical protein